jgi:hypothetical protein
MVDLEHVCASHCDHKQKSVVVVGEWMGMAWVRLGLGSGKNRCRS